tara:strand:+ start:4769 stop:5071 length:303 start_codon:yes stop_codon:yes gene_type:complete
MSIEIVQIVWTDAVTSAEAGWTSREEGDSIAREEIPMMSTVGYLIYEGTDWYSLTDSIGSNEYGQITKIPKSMVISIARMENNDEKNNKELSPPHYNSNF